MGELFGWLSDGLESFESFSENGFVFCSNDEDISVFALAITALKFKTLK